MERVATVGGRPIPVKRVEERLERLRRGPRGRHVPPDGSDAAMRVRRWLVQELVGEEIIAQEAERAGLPSDAGGQAVDRLRDLVTADVDVPEDEIRAYYERNPDLYRRAETRRVRHVVAIDEATARASVRRLAAAGASSGGLLQTFEVHRGELSGALEGAIFSAAEGEVVGPLRTELGWHVAVVEAVVDAHVVPYDDVRAGILEELRAAARERAFTGWLDRRRRELAVIEAHYEHPAHPIHGLPRHRH